MCDYDSCPDQEGVCPASLPPNPSPFWRCQGAPGPWSPQRVHSGRATFLGSGPLAWATNSSSLPLFSFSAKALWHSLSWVSAERTEADFRHKWTFSSWKTNGSECYQIKNSLWFWHSKVRQRLCHHVLSWELRAVWAEHGSCASYWYKGDAVSAKQDQASLWIKVVHLEVTGFIGLLLFCSQVFSKPRYFTI